MASGEEYMLHIYAMYLCAEKRETRSLSPLLRILSCPKHEALELLLGDTLTEAAGRIVASLYDADIAPIQELIEDSTAFDYASFLRGACRHGGRHLPTIGGEGGSQRALPLRERPHVQACCGR